MKKSLLLFSFAFLLSGCNILDSAPYGNCEIYFFSPTLKEFLKLRGECEVTDSLLRVTDTNGAIHTFNSASNYYSYQEGDNPLYKANTEVTANGRLLWEAREGGIFPGARVFLDFMPV